MNQIRTYQKSMCSHNYNQNLEQICPLTLVHSRTSFSKSGSNNMYSSSIQFSSNPSFLATQQNIVFANMGRFVKDQVDNDEHQFYHRINDGVIKLVSKKQPLTFRKHKNPKIKKMISSSINFSPVAHIFKKKNLAQMQNKVEFGMRNKRIIEVQEQELNQLEDCKQIHNNTLKIKPNNVIGLPIKMQQRQTVYFQLPSRKIRQNSSQTSQNSSYQFSSSRQKEITIEKLCIPTKKAIKIKVMKREDFMIGKKMGRGQFSEVMMAIHKQTGFLCGLKVMSKTKIKQLEYENQIARQLKIQLFLDHRNITPLYGYFQEQDSIYLIVQLCVEGQLYQKMKKMHQFFEEEISPIIREVCEGLNFIHQSSIIHRDIKPQNILLQFGTVKISDFGWAVHSNNEMRKTISGTPLYYSPEIILENDYDQKIDVWSVGMMTYECLFGRVPFRIHSQLDLKRIVQEEIDFPSYIEISAIAKDFMLKAMIKNPQQRIDISSMLQHPFLSQPKKGGSKVKRK